jgi:2-methylisocitrate lyase-like PEP mutase family enzyme
MDSKGARLKALINAPEILITPGIYDGFSARLVERAGFRTASIPVDGGAVAW